MIEKRIIQDLRKNYKLKSLDQKEVDTNPFEQFSIWFEEAMKSELPEPNSMILATATKDGKPSARALLLKGFDEKGFIFYTNYESRKGRELEENNNASMLFFWVELERQIRLEGKVSKITPPESKKYFDTRPYKSRIGAWASNQSTVIENRFYIVKKFLKYFAKFHSRDIPLPPYWGGYILVPESFEFWQGRTNRLHDRVRYRLEGEKWIIERLSP
ncbi:MAG: pyridoxamine 5'-phosphate oxidase [Ignavibacteriae bacterium]|nr:pyridoxamine 5'-phosphate oxidase [Ignavibacteriota bacterium]